MRGASGDARLDPPRDQPRLTVRLTSEPLDPAAALAHVTHPECGGVVVFSGVVRDHQDGAAVRGLEYEAWEERAAEALHEVAEEVLTDFGGVRAVYAVHRLGALEVGEVSVVVAASAPHRQEAFAAAAALIDRVKERVPIWKREHLEDGSSRWPGSEATAPR
jgi:molybdopterin synthase catalytic subunit